MKYNLKYLLLGVSTFVYFTVMAQKLPSTQKGSLWAPSSIKIDGESTEWNGNFQAYNTSTQVFYTIANDDQNLYLAMYIPNSKITFNKVMTGGITLTVKTKEDDVSLKYPAFPSDNGISLARVGAGHNLGGKGYDSIIVKDNAVFTDKAKEIEIKGIKGVDSLTSIFNEYGIKVSGRFDAKQGYLYELALPLKYLHFAASKPKVVSYKATLNGSASRLKTTNLPSVTGGTRPDGTAIPLSEIANVNAALLASRFELFSPTSFTGKYTLAVKP